MELMGAMLRAVLFEVVLSALEALVREAGRLIRALLRWALEEASPFDARFFELARNSVVLAALAAVSAAALALLLRYAARLDARPALKVLWNSGCNGK